MSGRRRTYFALVIATVGLAGSASLAADTAGPTWAGTWRTSWGDMELTQSGTTVAGTYEYDQGHISGTVSGVHFKGRWDEAPTRKGPADAGPVELTLSQGGTSMTGRWAYDASPTQWHENNWEGVCVSGPCVAQGKHRVTIVLAAHGLFATATRVSKVTLATSGRFTTPKRCGRTPSCTLEDLAPDAAYSGILRAQDHANWLIRFRLTSAEITWRPSTSARAAQLLGHVVLSTGKTAPCDEDASVRLLAIVPKQAKVVSWVQITCADKSGPRFHLVIHGNRKVSLRIAGDALRPAPAR